MLVQIVNMEEILIIYSIYAIVNDCVKYIFPGYSYPLPVICIECLEGQRS